MPEPPDDAVLFLDRHLPLLDAGDYTLAVEQPTNLGDEPYRADRMFTVAGERFALAPGTVLSTFPPDGGRGEYDNVLAHVVLDRPTLPWERSPDAGSAGGDGTPWLAVLVFADDEVPPPHIVTLDTLSADPAQLPVRERHQAADDPVTVVDVDAGLLDEILPTHAELSLLAHVRRSAGTETAVVVAARLPPGGRAATAHLVSLEGRFRPDRSGTPRFDPGPAGPVRLISLASWRFTTADVSGTFAGLAHDLARDGGSFRLPACEQPDAERLLGQGFVPVRYRRRDGAHDACWYRGPLVGGSDGGPVEDEPLPGIRAADALLRFHPDVGMLDVGDAVPWQLGRLLALQSTDVALAIRERRRRRRQLQQRRTVDGSLPIEMSTLDDALPGAVQDWLHGLGKLRGVPFGHLVPDERMLPAESVRIVTVDQRWVRLLVDGACSIGRLSSADAHTDAGADTADPPPVPGVTPVTSLTGALIRSALVDGYPDLVVEGFDEDGAPLPPARIEKVAGGTLLCLFSGVLKRLDLRQHPAAQHFGVEHSDSRTMRKTLRAVSGVTAAPAPVGPFPLSVRGKVPVALLTDAVAQAVAAVGGPHPFGPGELAAQLVEVAQRVSFTI